MRTPPCILIVDDNAVNVDILRTCLAAQGYEILTAGDGEAALTVATGQLPDLILLDVMMPKKDGLDVCRILKGDRSLPFIPIILVTARTDTQDVVTGLDAGADEYLAKPVDHAALVARVRSMLRIKELHDTIHKQSTQLEAQAAQLAVRNHELNAQLVEEAKLAEIARLLGDIGHDVKNMMMPILLGVDLLDSELNELLRTLSHADERRKQAAQEMSHEVFGMVRSNSRRVQDRVKELADAVKGRSGHPNFTPCRVATVVAAVCETLRLYAEQNQVRLSTCNLDDLPVIEADESRLFNALYNLVNNAIAETPAGGSITLDGRYNSEAQEVLLSVRDTGRGMSPEVQQSLFTNQVISRKVGGTGLGTKIVKDVVDSHAGSIRVDSMLGKGTTFVIGLPLDPRKIPSPQQAHGAYDLPIA